MKIRVLSISRLEDFIYDNNLEEDFDDYSDLTDEQFKELNEKLEDGWAFDSWDDFVKEFNADSNLAPVPSEHIIRAFND